MTNIKKITFLRELEEEQNLSHLIDGHLEITLSNNTIIEIELFERYMGAIQIKVDHLTIRPSFSNSILVSGLV